MTQSADITSALQRAQRAHREGRMNVVEEECRRVIERQPDNAEAWVLMATVARHHGYLEDAADMMRRAVQLKPDNHHMRRVLGAIYLQLRDWRNAEPIFRGLQEIEPDPEFDNALAKCDWGMGRYGPALERFRAAADAAPDNVALQVSLAQALTSLWRHEEAVERLREIAEQGAEQAVVWMLLGRHVFDDTDPSGAVTLLQRAAACPDASAEVHLNHAAMLRLAGRAAASEDAHRLVPDNPRLQAQWEALEYALSHRPSARLFGFGTRVLELALRHASVDGLTLEFGVYHGRSLRYIAEHVRSGLHGFDSFRGLPEDWKAGERAGSYSTGGRKPEMPGHVTLHEGWFEDTLPGFLAENRGRVRLAHLDCDLYSSTRTVLAHLRPRLVEGSILVFDDYTGYPGWREHEFRALREFAREHSLSYRYLAFGLLDRETAVELTRVG